MSDLTPERLAELRRIAEATGNVRFEGAGTDGRRMGINGIPFSFECGDCGLLVEHNQAIVADTPVGYFVAAFDPPTVQAMLDEIERLRRERDRGAVYTDFDRQIHVRVGRSESDDATQVYVTYLGWINEIAIPDGGSHDDVTAQTVAWPHGVKRSVAIVNETQAAEIEAAVEQLRQWYQFGKENGEWGDLDELDVILKNQLFPALEGGDDT